MQGDRKKCFAAGMDDYLSKPLKASELKAALERAELALERAHLPASGLNKSQTSPALADDGHKKAAAPVHLEGLQEATGNCTEELRETISLFLEEAEQTLDNLRLAIQSRNLEDVKALAHRLRGTSLSCGVPAMAEALLQLEQLDNRTAWSEAPELLTQTNHAFAVARDFLENART